jgi:redox-sensitive bicupin YhaK (pirin superfamily)
MKIRRSEERGHANHGWLDAHHTFSFAEYQDPEWVQFETLRVINQDTIQPSMGFGTHGHRDMEIVTYVLDGVLEHEDSMGNGSQIRPGEVQYMSAGRGVTHSEFNGSSEEPAHLLQMWVHPAEPGTEPRYDQRTFPVEGRRGRLQQVASPDGAGDSIRIGQDARLFVGLFDDGERSTHELAPDRSAWIHVARGRVRVNGEELRSGDGAGLRDAGPIELEGLEGAELVLWDLAKI